MKHKETDLIERLFEQYWANREQTNVEDKPSGQLEEIIPLIHSKEALQVVIESLSQPNPDRDLINHIRVRMQQLKD